MQLNMDELQRIIRDELGYLGLSMRPGGEFELQGFDPDYVTSPAIKRTSLALGESHPNLTASVSPGETVEFVFTVDLTDLGADERVGISVNAPAPEAGSSVFEILGRSYGSFNQPVGRFGPGIYTVRGILYNGNRGGILSISFGTPQAGLDIDLGDFESREGTESIDLSAGFWLVTWSISQQVDIPEVAGIVPVQEVSAAGYSEAWILPFGEEVA